MRNLLLVLIAIITLSLAAVFAYNKSMTNSSTVNKPSSSPDTTITPTNTVGSTKLKIGGNSFSDPKGVFVFLYPTDYKMDTEGDGQYTRITKIGATQKGQTELYDGVIAVFESIELKNQTLEQIVDTNIENSTKDGLVKVISPKNAITMNGYPGFTYTTEGLGAATYYYLQKNASSPFALVVTTAVFDPEKKDYQTELDDTLSTIEILK